MKQIIILLMVFIIGCSGSSSSSSSGSQSDSGTKKIIADFSKYTAIVCYDRNQNKKCDIGEPAAVPSPDGSYDIATATADDISNVPLIAELSTKTFAASNLILETPATKSLLSYYTTMVKNTMDTDASYSIADAEKLVLMKIGKNIDSNIYSEGFYDESIKKLNNDFVSIANALHSKAATEGVSMSPALVAAISNIITDAISEIVELIANGKDAEKEITDNTEINNDVVKEVEDKIEQTNNSVDADYVNKTYYGLNIRESVQVWNINMQNNKEYKQKDDVKLINYLTGVVESGKLNGSHVSSVTESPITATNFYDLYMSLNDYSDYRIENKLKNISVNFPANAKSIKMVLKIEAFPKFSEMNANYPRLDDGSMSFDHLSYPASDLYSAIEQINKYSFGGFVWANKYAILLKNNGFAEFYDARCVNNNNGSRDMKCYKFAKKYERNEEYILLKNDTWGGYIYWDYSKNKLIYDFYNNPDTIMTINMLNEAAVEYLASLPEMQPFDHSSFNIEELKKGSAEYDLKINHGQSFGSFAAYKAFLNSNWSSSWDFNYTENNKGTFEYILKRYNKGGSEIIWFEGGKSYIYIPWQ